MTIREDINFDSIPPELKTFPNWVNWTAEIRNGKPTKIPINPKTGYRAKSNNSSTWGTFEQAVRRWKGSENGGIKGIGFVFSKDDPYSGTDLDHCRNPENDTIEPWAMGIIQTSNSYSEVSPSETGIKIFTKGNLPVAGDGSKNGNIEMYHRRRFFTVTGWHLEGTPLTIESRQEELDKIYTEYFGHRKKSPINQTPPTPVNASDSELIEKAKQASNGEKFSKLWAGDWKDYPSQSEADLAFCSMLTFWTGRDSTRIDRLFRQSGLMRPKWKEKHFGDGTTYGQHTVQTAIEGTIEVYTPPVHQTPKDSVMHDTTCFSVSKKETHEQVIPNLDFPRETIGGLAGRFAEVFSSYLESPYSFFVFNFLTCFGNLIGDRITLASEITPQPRLYTCTIGQSGDARKSESQKRAVKFFSDTFSKGEFNVCQGVGSAEGLALKLSKIEQNPKRLLLVYDEAKAFVSKARIDGSTLLPAVNTFFESNQFHSATKSHDIAIDNAYLSFLAAATRETFERMWTSDFLDIGFINRLWLVYDHAERRFSIPREVPSSDLESMRKKLIEILRGIPEAGLKFDIDEDAREIFDAWYLSDESHKSPLSKRLDTYGLRLMILLAMNDGTSTINAQISENVVKLLQWQLQIRRECDVIDAETNVAKVEELIRRSLSKGPLSPRELKQRVHYSRYGIYIFQLAIENLQKEEEVFFDRQAKLYYLGSGLLKV